MGRRYFWLWLFSFVLEFLGVFVWALTATAVVAVLTISPQFIPTPGDWLSNLIFTLVQVGIWRMIVGGVLGGLSLLASGQFISLMMDVEENTRALRIKRERELMARYKASKPRSLWED
jgi:hypothetical protein